MIYTNEDLNGFFVGSFFGDGCFVKRSKTHNTYVSFKHSENQKMYLEWKYDFLKKFWLVKDKPITEKKLMGCYENAQKQYGFNSNSCEQLNRFKLQPRIELIKDFNEMSLAVYALDDGSFYGHTCKISCGTLNENEREIFCNILKNNIDIDCVVYHNDNCPEKDYFYISKESYDKLIKIILSKIPNDLDIIQNKIQKGNNKHEN